MNDRAPKDNLLLHRALLDDAKNSGMADADDTGEVVFALVCWIAAAVVVAWMVL